MMLKSKLPLRTEADRDAALFARSCVLLLHWLNVVEARGRAASDLERARVAAAEADLVSETSEFLRL